jgi:hypothetical protein
MLNDEVGRFRAYTLISRAVEEGARFAYNRAYKHLPEGQHPTQEEWIYCVEIEVMLALGDIMDFPPYDDES